MPEVAIVGVPTSAGAFAPGQEGAPAALRAAGLVERLREAGVGVVDRGDREVWRWRADRVERRAQNLGKVVEVVRETAGRVADAVGAGELPLVLGGDCTVGIGTVAGVVAAFEAFGEGEDRGTPSLTNREVRPGVPRSSLEPRRASVGLLYLDSHADLNVPSSVHEGALDWMGLAHMLAVDGARSELVEAGPRVPLLQPDAVTLVGLGPEQATEFEREQIERLGLEVFDVGTVAADPAGATRRAVASLEARCERLVVHCDVDLVDFTDTPLSENWGRNEGLPFDSFLTVLRTALEAPALAATTITELNPDHTEPGAAAIERLAQTLATGLGTRSG
jgi:arginase